ncbi:MAG: DNA polymerase III subunit gamma/tau [Phormidesmis sp.]
MYEPLHHKYRPQTFAQLVGQGAIATTLTHALEQNRIAPAYLFCGPRGTGKTSSARILAKSLNCLNVAAPTAEPCGECDVCTSVTKGSSLDIVEIDAASNTGVDNIRELIERSQFAPVQCRYKVYVIDECHMLSTAAFNALLKTLEEPPDRVVFVLATTDPQRVLPTIISRCQRFDFRRIPLPSMVKHLQHIATEEAIAIAPSATQLVAQISQGGLRDAESLLDQLSLQPTEITVESVWELVGAVPERDLLNLVRAIAADDGPVLIDRVRQLMDKGREPLIVLQSLVGFYRDLLIAKRAPSREDLVAITPPTWLEMTDFAQRLSAAQILASQQKLQNAEVQVKNTTQPRLWLEVTLTGLLPSALSAMADLTHDAPPRGVHRRPDALAAATQPPATLPSAPLPTSQPPASSAPSPTSEPPAPTSLPPEVAAPPAVTSGISPVVSPVVSKGPAEVPAEKPAEDPDENLKERPPEERPPVEVPFSNLADLWNQLLAVMVPRGTQMLMAQQGVLLSFDGVGAKVGFRSASLQKLAQSRVPNIEATFESLFQRKIKVALEVIAAEESPAQAFIEPPPAPPAPPVRRDPSHQIPSGSPPLPSDVQSSGQTPFSSEFPSQQASEPAKAGEEEKEDPFSASERDRNTERTSSNSSSTNGSSTNGTIANSNGTNSTGTNSNSARSRLDAPAFDVSFDQDQEKIKRFADFFNGQIVNLSDDAEEGPDSHLQARSAQPKSSDPGPDVPF